MLRKALIIITLLPAGYFWLGTAILGITKPFFASLVIGGLLGFVGLIRAGWSFGGDTPSGRRKTRFLLGIGLVSALTGVTFLFRYLVVLGSDPAPIGVVAVGSLLAISAVGVVELIRTWGTSDTESAD